MAAQITLAFVVPLISPGCIQCRVVAVRGITELYWSFHRVNSLRPTQNRRHFADDVFKCNFMNENVWIPNKISLKFVHEGPINNISALVQILARRRIGDKPLSEPMMTQFNDAYMRHSASMSYINAADVLFVYFNINWFKEPVTFPVDAWHLKYKCTSTPMFIQDD